MIWEERVKAERAAERASRPKKVKPKKDDYEVEAIKGQLFQNCFYSEKYFYYCECVDSVFGCQMKILHLDFWKLF
jgi:hypothetical protein